MAKTDTDASSHRRGWGPADDTAGSARWGNCRPGCLRASLFPGAPASRQQSTAHDSVLRLRCAAAGRRELDGGAAHHATSKAGKRHRQTFYCRTLSLDLSGSGDDIVNAPLLPLPLKLTAIPC